MPRMGLGFQRFRQSPWRILFSALLSAVLAVGTQFILALVPRLFPSLSLLAMLPVSAVVFLLTAFLSKCLRWLLGVSALALAFVLFSILFLWGVYITIIRKAVPSLLDATFNAECALLLFGLYRIFSSDPGMVAQDYCCPIESDQNVISSFFSRVRQCSTCKACVKGFDHHCPAFGNCIGQKNHRLFIFLLSGFVIVEASYTICSTQYINKCLDTQKTGLQSIFSANLVISTMLFSVLQVGWQVLFLIWHIYCICVNIKTDEWVNWKRYPDFQTVIQPQPGSPLSEIRFTNPYDKGIMKNIKNFLERKD